MLAFQRAEVPRVAHVLALGVDGECGDDQHNGLVQGRQLVPRPRMALQDAPAAARGLLCLSESLSS